MSANSELPPKNDGAQTSRRLKLVMPNTPSQTTPTQHALQENASVFKESSRSPTRPSYSPVTPTLPESGFAFDAARNKNLPQEQWMETPPPVPVSLDDNVDAIALRSAISILQMQRQQSLKDIKQLDRIKKAALEDPQSFVNDLGHGRLDSTHRTAMDVSIDDEMEDDDASDQDHRPESSIDTSKFGKLPSAQNVVRAPPIEWSKYRVAGEALDRLHEVQQHYPGWTDDSRGGVGQSQPHNIAAPYRPFTDRVDTFQPSMRHKESHS